MSLASDLSPKDLCRVLELADLLTRVRPDCPLPLLPAWNRNQALLDAWSAAFAAKGVQAIMQELGEILRAAQ
jgi:hypothetical protein